MGIDKVKIQDIKFNKICFTHEGHDPVLMNADFDFPMEKVCWIQSSEGAGKSTLLQILAGLVTPHSGEYLINGVDTVDMSFEEFLPYRHDIGYSFDYGGLINNRTLFDNLMLPLVYHKVLEYPDAKKRVQEFLDRYSVSQFAQERPAHVPGRVRKLVCLIRAMITYPGVLLMDDPSVGLGQETINTFINHLNELRCKGFCLNVFMSSYDEKFMGQMNSESIFLDGGMLYLRDPFSDKKVVNL